MSDISRAIAQRFSNVIRVRDDMHGYQQTAVQFAKDHPFSLLLIDLGLGKTISSLTVISDILLDTDFDAGPVLVIAPLKVARNVWPNEIGLWGHTAWLSHVLIRPEDDDPRIIEARRKDSRGKKDRDKAKRKLKAEGLTDEKIAETIGPLQETQVRHQIMCELAQSKALVHIINREQVEWLVNLHRAKWPYRTVFIDESDSFQDWNSQRFKALAKVRRTPGLIERMHLLTATPASESYLNLWSQIYLLDLGQRFGKSIGPRFRDVYFTHNEYSRTYKIKPGAEDEILEKIADITLVMEKEDYLPRNEPTIIPRKVALSVTEQDMVRELERELVITLPNGVELEAKTAAHLGNMLLQLASGALYETALVEDEEDADADLIKVKKTHHIHDHKIEALREIYESCRFAGEPLLVSYHFKSSLDRLKKAFPKAVVMSRDGREEKDWNKKKIPMMFIHPQSAGHGLNLQHGGSNLVFFDMIYSLRYYLQTIGRIDRQGQTKPVVVQLLLAEGTRDEDAYEALSRKEDGQERFYFLLKKLIRNLRKSNRVVD